MELKVHCDCGQKFKFDVEPVNNRMPFTVACPICHRDGTEKANAMLHDEVKEFREKSLPEYQDLASGKLTKEAYLVRSGRDPEKLKQLEKTEDSTFKGIFMLLTLNARSIISLVVGAGLAFKLSTNA